MKGRPINLLELKLNFKIEFENVYAWLFLSGDDPKRDTYRMRKLKDIGNDKLRERIRYTGVKSISRLKNNFSGLKRPYL